MHTSRGRRRPLSARRKMQRASRSGSGGFLTEVKVASSEEEDAAGEVGEVKRSRGDRYRRLHRNNCTHGP